MIAGYEYRYSDDPEQIEAASWVDAGLTATVDVSGLTNGTMYAFQVRSRDLAGNYSDPSRVFYETTPMGDSIPPVLTGPLTLTATGSHSFTAEWPPALDPAGDSDTDAPHLMGDLILTATGYDSFRVEWPPATDFGGPPPEDWLTDEGDVIEWDGEPLWEE